LFPGLAVAERLAATVPRARITFCGGGKPFERRSIVGAGFDYFALPARPFPHGAREAVAFVVENLGGYVAAGRFLREEHVALVVGLGGYASVPMARAAVRRRVPLVLLEQNVVPGKATRWLAHRATLICTAFEQTQEKLRCQCPVRVTGNPIRHGFRIATSGAEQRRLLVLGGSNGARSLNENVPRALYKNYGSLRNWTITHQCGESDVEAVRTLYDKFALKATAVPFLSDMPEVLGGTDLAICRAGGTTLAELATAGVPAIVVPYPHATDDHQLANARHFAVGGGCVTIDERGAQGRLDDRMADMVCFLVANDELRRRMSAAMLELAKPNAADDVAELIWSIASSRSRRAEPILA